MVRWSSLGKGDGTFTARRPCRLWAHALIDHGGRLQWRRDLGLGGANNGRYSGNSLGNGDGTFTPSASLVVNTGIPFAITTGDFNGDGHLDLAVALLVSNQVAIFLGNGDGTFTRAPLSPSTGQSPIVIAVSDLNRDGKLDLVTGNEESANMTILLGNGDGTFTSTASPVSIPGVTGGRGHQPCGGRLRSGWNSGFGGSGS